MYTAAMKTYHAQGLGLLDLFQNSSASVRAEFACVTDVKSEGTKVLHWDGAAAVQLSHPLRSAGREGRGHTCLA